jgi:hypothetical protein
VSGGQAGRHDRVHVVAPTLVRPLDRVATAEDAARLKRDLTAALAVPCLVDSEVANGRPPIARRNPMASTSTHRRLGQTLAAAVAAAALLAHAAAASNNRSCGPPDPSVRYATSIIRANTPDPWFNYALSLTRADTSSSSQLMTDTLAPGGGPAETSKGYTFVSDTLAPGGGQGGPLGSAPSFSWPDAGIGAGVAIASMLCLLGVALVLTRRRGRLAV